jgi:hypothetical protein
VVRAISSQHAHPGQTRLLTQGLLARAIMGRIHNSQQLFILRVSPAMACLPIAFSLRCTLFLWPPEKWPENRKQRCSTAARPSDDVSHGLLHDATSCLPGL